MGSEKASSEKASFKNQDIITIDISNENHSDLMNIMNMMDHIGIKCENVDDCITELISFWYKGEKL